MTMQELTGTVRELRELRTMAEELAAEIAALEDTLKAEMQARGTDELKVDTFKVRWTPYTSRRFDSAAFKAEHAALYDKYTKTVEARRFTIQ